MHNLVHKMPPFSPTLWSNSASSTGLKLPSRAKIFSVILHCVHPVIRPSHGSAMNTINTFYYFTTRNLLHPDSKASGCCTLQGVFYEKHMLIYLMYVFNTASLFFDMHFDPSSCSGSLFTKEFGHPVRDISHSLA